MPDFARRAGATLPHLDWTLDTTPGAPGDLTGCTVVARLTPLGSTGGDVLVSPCEIRDAAGGVVRMPPPAPGDWLAYFRVTDPAGGVQDVPRVGGYWLQILP